MVPFSAYLLLGALLFAIGLAGALTRRNVILLLVSIEIMINAAILNFVVFWHFGKLANISLQVFALFGLVIAGTEAAVGLALVIAVFRHLRSVNVEEVNSLKG